MKKTFKLLLIICALWGIENLVKSQITETITTGAGTWICPPGVTSVTVECWGGGGAGGAAKNTTGGNSARGGGGCGGGYSKITIPVAAGTEYNYSVGAGAVGVVLTSDNEVAPSGTNSFFVNITTVNAPGGNGGIGRLCGAGQTNAAGVLYTPTTTAAGDVKWNGGGGGAASGSSTGKGGGSAGTESNGNDASTTAVTGGGAGGNSRSGAGNGNSGGAPGGGGAGAKADANQDRSGGNGGNGKIIITLTGLTTIASGETLNVAAGENLTIPLGTTFTVASGGTLNVAIGGTITNNGTITNDGTLTVNGTISNIGTAVVNGTGTFNLNSGATINDISNADGLNATTGQIRCSTRNFDAGANYSFKGTVAQVSGADFPATVNNLTIDNSTGVTLSGNLTVNGTILIMTTSYIGGSGDFTLSAGATINTTSALGLNATTGPIRCTGTRTFSTSANYIFNGTAAQVPGTDFPSTVNNLTISNSTGVTLSTPLTVNGVLTITSGALTNGANLTLGNSASIVRAGGSLVTAPTFGTNKDITYSGTSAITAGVELPSEATSLTVSNTGGVTLSGALTVSGATSITGKLILGNTLTANSALTVGAAGTLQLNDGAALAGSGAVTYTSGGTLMFNKTSGTTISGSETYWPSSNGPSNVSVLQNTLTLDVNRVISGIASVSTSATLITNANKQLTVGTIANAGKILNMGTLTGSSTGAGFIVNASANDNAKGSVTGSVTGADVSLTAIPASGYYFVNWTEAPTGAIGTDAALAAFTISVNRTIVANFSEITDLNNAMTHVFASVENRKVFINGELNAIEIFNAQGKLVYAKKQTVNSVSIPTNGIYIVKMHTPVGIKIQKLSVM